jgi:glutathionylspermidine synthase
MIAAEVNAYASFAERVRQGGLLSDPWIGGKPRFATAPILLPESRWQAVAEAAQAMAEVHQELVGLVLRDQKLFEAYFRLGAAGRALWECAAPHWHGIARADVFLTADGPVLCEINADTPSGQAEAITLSRLFEGEPGRDPNAELEARFCAYLGFEARRLGKELAGATVGILYPTELTEDLGLVLLYERWLVARGARVVLGSPFNLQAAPDGRVTLLGQPCDLVIRHYKTDWWVEREPVWTTEAPFPDAEPLTQALVLLVSAEQEGKVAVVNPFGAIVPQNKRSLALLWEERSRFTDDGRRAIERYLPPSFRLESQPMERLRREREAWVLKSDYGCEGEETVVGRATTQAIWEASLAEAAPGRWMVQHAFTPLRDQDVDSGSESGLECNLGVYLVAGMACGLYARRSVGPTDVTALSTAVRIAREPSS